MRSFMDEVSLQRAPEGGMEVIMVKRAVAREDCSRRHRMSTPDPSYLATAVEIVLRAGDIQLARRHPAFASTRKAQSISSRRSIWNASASVVRYSPNASRTTTSWPRN